MAWFTHMFGFLGAPRKTSRPSKSPRTRRLQFHELEPRLLLSGQHLDFGSATSPVASGYVGAPVAGYTAAAGYGWIDSTPLLEVVRSSGSELTRDFHAGKDSTFQLDLPNGTYLVTPTLGDATTVRDDMDVYLNGNQVAADLSVPAGQPYRPTYQVEVTDGKLTLRLVDQGGETVRWALSALDVVAATPVVNAGPDRTASEGTTVAFQGSASGAGPLTYFWDFGDGQTTANTLSPKHIYADNGNYTVTFRATNAEGQTSEDAAMVTVKNSAPKVALTGVPTSGAKEGTAINLGSKVSDPGAADLAAGLKMSWFVTKNGRPFASASGTMQQFSFTPDDDGTYVVKVTATDKDGSTSMTASAKIVAADTPLRPNILGPYSGNVDAAVHFVGIARDNGPLDAEAGYTYAWRFGDGGTATGPTPDHQYVSPGTYTVTMTVTGSNGAPISTTTTVTIGTATTAVPANDYQMLVTNLLGNTVYSNVGYSEMAASGAWGVNADWEQGKSSKWYIEQQRNGENLIIDGLLHNKPASIAAGFKVFDWGFTRQAADGSFAGTQDPFHSTSFFVAAVARACLLIEQSPYASLYQAKVDAYKADVHRAALWMAKPDVWSRGLSNNSPYTHRNYLVAAAMGLTSELVGGDATLMALARSQIQAGLARQTANGVNPECGGYDSSYQPVGLSFAQLWTVYFPTDSLTPSVKVMLDKGLAWEHSRILATGQINTEGNTRVGSSDTGPSGTIKTVDWRRAVTAFAWGFQATGDARWQSDAQRIAEYYFKAY